MSGVAGIIHFDGKPAEPGQIEAMTAAMRHRGPDGISHWRQGPVALGQCMLRTTPESLEEHLPLSNNDGTLMLVMDGRVDNFEDLRRELLGRGVVLRSRADAELVLRAYESWGEDCVHHIVGECVFFIWDARRQVLFAGRDAAGARHFYYYVGRGWFGFASEIKGLLALPQIERRLNDSRVLDYLVPEFDRDDEVGTFWRDILRLPAGHAMRVTADGAKTWRWWHPGELGEQKFASMAECTDAFMDQLRVAVRCRLRSIKPVGAMLSGGLDSSSIVGLISKEFRDQLNEPLRTVSLIREDRENCLDWHSIKAILDADAWLSPTVLTSRAVDEALDEILTEATKVDEPFAFSHGLTYYLTYRAARQVGCSVLLDGMAGDLLFYSPARSMIELVRRHRYRQVLELMTSYRRHGWNTGWSEALRAAAGAWAPDALRAQVRKRRFEQRLRSGDLALIRPELARPYLASKLSQGYMSGDQMFERNDQVAHARYFTTGLNSFGHETYGPLAFAHGVEPRSPYSDRRLIEFGIRTPLAAKLALPWYKHLMRHGTTGMLPESVRWRLDMGNHPGWTYYERLWSAANALPKMPVERDSAPALKQWLSEQGVRVMETRPGQETKYEDKLRWLGSFLHVKWLGSTGRTSDLGQNVANRQH